MKLAFFRPFRWPAALALLALLAVAAAGYGAWSWMRGSDAPRYATAQVTTGEVARTITATGTVNPVATVQVGTYVSGVIRELRCDYNTQVRAGQLCAKIDPRPYESVVEQQSAALASAQAQLRKDQANLALLKTNYERDLGLLKQGIVSQESVDSVKSSYEQAQAQIRLTEASIRQRQAELSSAKVNLNYTDIVSPVDGTVVARNVDVGQTVAASFQTPTLFLIAKDLTKMQVETNVSESDIGGVLLGQRAWFTVEAFPGRIFEGRVEQLRQAPITVQNVVTYTVVVSVNNPDGALLPGMTANTRIVTAERNDVLRVPVTALRFTPQGAPAETRKAPEGGDQGAAAAGKPEAANPNGADQQGEQKGRHKRGQAAGDQAAGNGAPPITAPEPGAGKPQAVQRRERPGRVWVEGPDGLSAVPVTVGLTDSNFAEVTSGDLKPGDEVVVGEAKADQKARAGGAQQRQRPPRFGF